MALSPSHKFGQIIGELLEMTVEPILAAFAEQHGFYLDKKGPRSLRKGDKLSWTDLNGNKHDLDFVIERGGTPEKQGIPVAFIETAWRRYARHSRNKTQEIQGAIVPLFQTHKRHHPFIGVVLAGVFIQGALTQLKSLGFAVAYFPYETVVQAFSSAGIDAASEERTPDRNFAAKNRRWRALSIAERRRVCDKLAELNQGEIAAFKDALLKVTTRTIKAIRILPLHGQLVEWADIEDAITFIRDYRETASAPPIIRYEVEVVYVNGDRISGEFAARDEAIAFLEGYAPVTMPQQDRSVKDHS